nr:transporter substrate-binding domain-containing protein [Brachybacterium sp. Marseille-Q7125]
MDIVREVIRTPARHPARAPLPTIWLVLTVIVILVITAVIVRADPPERSRPLQISTSEWLPYISPDLPGNGPVAELLTEVLGRAGYTPVFVFSTWPLAERDVINGASVGMAPVIISDSRAEFALYSDPLLDFRYTLFGKSDDLVKSLPDRTDLTGVRVARISGYQYWDELDESGATFSDHPSALAAFDAVADGDADLVAEGSLAGWTTLAGPDFSGDVRDFSVASPASPLTSSTKGLHLLVKDSTEGKRLLKEFNEALADFQATEDYDRLLGQLSPSTTPVVLRSPDGSSVAVQNPDDDSVSSTPSGTSAVVLSWPEGELTAQSPIEVKIIEGPLRGQVRLVRLGDVEISHA